jgi:amino acid transporter
LLLAYIVWCAVIYFVNEAQGEMVCALPIESSFSRFAARYVDDAFGAATAANYFLCMTSLLCFEVTAFHSIVGFWGDIHPAIIPAAMLTSYCIIHLWSSKWFGESECSHAYGVRTPY